MGPEFRIGNKQIELTVVSGVVAQSSLSNSSHYSEQFSNLMGGTYQNSELREETNFFFQRDDGHEHAVSFPAQIALRGGHRVTVVYGMCADGKSLTAIGMLNETLGAGYELPVKHMLSRLEVEFGRAPVSRVGCGTILAMIAFMVLSAVFSKNWLDWTLFSSFFWKLLGVSFLVLGAGLYLIDPLINGSGMKKIEAAFKGVMAGIAESRRALKVSSTSLVAE